MPLTTYGRQALPKLLGSLQTKPATWYVGLHTAAPPTATNEIAGAGYARQSVAFAASLALLKNSADITFTAGASWASTPIACAGVWDAATGGNCWWYEATQAAGTTYRAAWAAISSGGAGYTSADVGAVLTVAGGTAGTAAVITITAVAAGLVTGIKISTVGNYTALPADPITATGSTIGLGLTVAMTWAGDQGTAFALASGDALQLSACHLSFALA